MDRTRLLGSGIVHAMLAALFAVLMAGGAWAAESSPIPPAPAGEREITVLNKSKKEINEVYVAPASATDWGDDRLGDDTIDPGDTYHIKLGRMRECGFDVHIVYEDGSKEENLNVNVCRTKQLAFDGSTAVAPPPREEHAVVIVNNASRPIQMVFISPAESNDWGDDRLADDSISVGESKRVTYRGDCAADLRIVFDNRGAEERKGLNLCDTPQISIQPGWTAMDSVPTGDVPSQPGLPPAHNGSVRTPANPAPATPPAIPSPAMLNITVQNHSGHDAAELYLFPQGNTDRGQDRLGMTMLRNNGQLTIRIPKGDQCRFDVHVVYSGNVPDADLKGVDVCATPQVTLQP
jgi:hypothetical protein